MFYTKYRPQKFSEISKPNDAADAISTQVKNGKTAHAYLFVGPRGTGKTTTARILAKALNCGNLQKNGDPCDKCANCIAIISNSFLDLIEIDAASNRGIDDIRELKEKIKLVPSSGKKKVYIIDEVHMLTMAAFNALLKTLEEPPSHATFILCTTELHKVPETIKSRCQIFKFKRASVSQIVERLEKITASEGGAVSNEDLRQIASSVHGGFRDAETLLQQVIEGEIAASALLNVGSLANFYDFVESLINKDHKSALRLVNKLYLDGVDLYVWAGELLKYLRNVLLIMVDAEKGLVDISDDLLKDIKDQAKKVTIREIVNLLFTFEGASRSIKSSFITQLPLEITIVKICGGNSEPAGDELSVAPPVIPAKVKTSTEPASAPNVSKPKAVPSVNIDKKALTNGWQDIISELSSINNTTAALLKVCKISEVIGNDLYLEVPFDFHKERIENSRNRNLIEGAISQVVGAPVSVSCIVKKRDTKLTDYNVMIPSGVQDQQAKEELLQFFAEGLA